MTQANEKYDVIVVGTGFASTFFLAEYLPAASASSRILLLERGRLDTHEWQLENLKTTNYER